MIGLLIVLIGLGWYSCRFSTCGKRWEPIKQTFAESMNNLSDRLSGKSRQSEYTLTVPLGGAMGELKQRARAGSQSSSSSDRGSVGDRSSISSLSNDEYGGGDRRVSVKASSSKRSPEYVGSSDKSERTVSFRPKMITTVRDLSFRSVNSDNASVDSEFASLTGVPPPLSLSRKQSSGGSSKVSSRLRGGGEAPNSDSSNAEYGQSGRSGLLSSSRSSFRPGGDSFKRSNNPLKMGVSGVTIMEGDEADGEFIESSAALGAGAGAGGEYNEANDPYEDFNSYHLSYLLGVKAGAKAAAEGQIGGETSDSGHESRVGAGGGGARHRLGEKDDVYWLGYQHGREHGLVEQDGTVPYDVETGQPLSIDERIANLTNASASRIQDTSTYWDTPSAFEQVIIDACCLRSRTIETLCCQRGCCCLNRDTTDACWVFTCGLGSVAGFVIFLGIYF